MPQTPTYTNWEAVKATVASALHLPAAEMDPTWDTGIARATQDAAAEIKRVLVLKGYTPAQIAASDDARAYNDRLGAFFALTRGAVLTTYDLKAVEWLDCRKELQEAAALVINDVAVGPPASGSEIGGVAFGTLGAVAEVTAAQGDWFV